MRVDKFAEAVVDLFADLPRHHRFERRWGKLDRKVARTAVSGVDDLASRTSETRLPSPNQKMRDVLNRLLRCRQAHPQQAIAAQGAVRRSRDRAR